MIDICLEHKEYKKKKNERIENSYFHKKKNQII